MTNLIVDFPTNLIVDFPTNLIVDFPTNLSLDSPHHQAGYCTGKANAPLAVRFSSVPEVRLVQRHARSDVPNIWYSREDIAAMKMKHERKIRKIWKRLGGVVDSLAENDTRKVDHFGIENRLSPQLVRKTVECRQQCFSAVMTEQARQEMTNEHEPSRIACIANHYTGWSAVRACAIGLSQFQYDS